VFIDSLVFSALKSCQCFCGHRVSWWKL